MEFCDTLEGFYDNWNQSSSNPTKYAHCHIRWKRIGDNELTISVWVKHSSNDGEKTFISKGQSTHSIPAESGYLLMVDNGKYIVRYHDDQGRGLDVSANIENLNYWTQLVYRLSRQGDSATLTLFINGELVASSTGQVGSSNSQSNLSFGYHSKPINAHGSFIVGEVDDVRIYNRALSETEVFDLEFIQCDKALILFIDTSVPGLHILSVFLVLLLSIPPKS